MTHAEILRLARDVPARFAPRWQADPGERVSGTVRLCSCKLRGDRGLDAPSAKWHRSGSKTRHPHPNGGGVSSAMAEMLWIASMAVGLVKLGKLPNLQPDTPLVATLARACIEAGPGEADEQPVHSDDPLIHHAPVSVVPAPSERAMMSAYRAAAKLLGEPVPQFD